MEKEEKIEDEMLFKEDPSQMLYKPAEEKLEMIETTATPSGSRTQSARLSKEFKKMFIEGKAEHHEKTFFEELPQIKEEEVEVEPVLDLKESYPELVMEAWNP